MSLDETHLALLEFRRALDRFNEGLTEAVAALEARHRAVDPLWRDRFRQQYDQRWAEFGKHLDTYLAEDAERYRTFITERARLLGRYLGHG